MLPMFSFFILPDICSGDHRFFKCSVTYKRIFSFFNLSFLPLHFLFSKALSWAILEVYTFLSGGKFLRSSLETDDGDRPSSPAIFLIELLPQCINCNFSLSSIEKCLNFITLLFY